MKDFQISSKAKSEQELQSVALLAGDLGILARVVCAKK